MIRPSGAIFPLGITLLLALLFATIPAPEATGEIYKWTDEKGVMHFTDDSGRLPQSKRGQANRIVPDKPASGGPEFAWFSPKAPPGENFLGDVRFRYGGKGIILKRIYVRRFMGRIARDTSVGMSEWWFDAVLDTELETDPRKLPRFFISLVDRNRDPTPVYYETEGRIVRAPGTNAGNPRLLCWPAVGKDVAGMYYFYGYSPENTGVPGAGQELLDAERLSSRVLFCFLGCTPPDAPVAGIRVEIGDAWSEEQLRRIKQGGLP